MSQGKLHRQIGLGGACLLGLGSILGSGVFVSLAIGADVAGWALLPAITAAAFVALCNGLSSAQLAAAFPQSGGTYEFGYRLLHPAAGFTAGWMFLVAKSATAATAALAVPAYIFGSGDHRTIGVAIVIAITLLVLGGIRRSNWANAILVALAAGALLAFVIALDSRVAPQWVKNSNSSAAPFLQTVALMFVAFTGYGRIATMGEEVIEPRKTIPRAILVTLAVTLAIYIAVAHAAMRQAGDIRFGELAGSGRALVTIASDLDISWLVVVLGIGAVAAMLGVLLNLILGLSRVLLAMGRRRDVPSVFGKVNQAGTTPAPAVLGVTGLVLALVLVGDIRVAWSLSAFTVLVYYGFTNLCCLLLPAGDRLYPRAFAFAGLASCFFLAFWVETRFWLIGLGLIAAGLVWHLITLRLRSTSQLAG